MRCPKCKNEDTKVVDSRPARNGDSIRRRRVCPKCGFRFTTYEVLDTCQIRVRKENGRLEYFNPQKLLRSMTEACKNLNIETSLLEDKLDEVIEELQKENAEFVNSQDIRNVVSRKLKGISPIAFLRYVSIYFDEKKLEDVDVMIQKAVERIEVPQRHPELSLTMGYPKMLPKPPGEKV